MGFGTETFGTVTDPTPGTLTFWGSCETGGVLVSFLTTPDKGWLTFFSTPDTG